MRTRYIWRKAGSVWKVVHANDTLKQNSVALVRTRTVPTERPPPVGEVSANFCG